MRIKITILSGDEDESYTAHSAEECRDSTDRAAYQMAAMLGQAVVCGCVIAEPITHGE